MFRVALSAGLAIFLGACSLGSGSISSGFADSSSYTTNSIGASPSVKGVALGGDPGASRGGSSGQKYAALNDRAPTGTYERAPAGALSDRDYSSTALSIDKARDIINQYRRDKDLKPLKINAELTAAAKSHSRDLAKWDRISHYGSDGSNPWDRVKRTGYRARLAAENVGTGQVDFNEVMRGWRESPGHNKNLLLADATHMGIALVQDPKSEFKTFWTLVVGAPM
ncbi:MAG: CAP domain-containing protein [Hyphomicrobiaceae bacterium]|nr:CAP domain-containing protein [Hyphomicrobiaceae bacterium]